MDVTKIGTPDRSGFVLSTESKPRLEEGEIFSCDHKQVDDRKLTSRAGWSGRWAGRERVKY